MRATPLVAWFVVVSLLIYGATRDPTLSGWAWTVGVIGALFVVPNAVARMNARIWIRGDELRYRGILRVVRKCRLADVQSVAFVRIAVLGRRFAFGRLLLLDRDSVAMVSIQEEWWSPDDLERLRRVLDVSTREVEGVMKPSEVNRSYGGAASPLLAHWVAATALLLMVLVIVVAEIVNAVGPKAH